MYQVEARISDRELMKEHRWSLKKACTVSARDITCLLGGIGEIESYHDDRTMEQVITGTRQDEFPYQCWPLRSR